MTNLCKDCINFRPASGDTWDHTDICAATIVRSPDVVHGGSHVTGYIEAQDARKANGVCGPEGKLWSPKPPSLLTRLLQKVFQ
jgi:hypothetical protein